MLADPDTPTHPFPNAMAEQNDTSADNGAAPDEAISRALRSLAEYKEQHLQLLAEIMMADGANLFHVDLVVMAAMHRSLALIDGFTTLVEQRNALAAIPLIRMQIDSIIRTYACWTVEKPPVVAQAMLADTPLNKIKSRTGEPLTDAYLYQAAAEHYPWIPAAYRQISGFVHLSGRHIMAPMHADEPRTGHFIVGSRQGWSDVDVIGAIDTFAEATRCLLHLCWSWLKTKEMGRLSVEERAAKLGVPPPDEPKPQAASERRKRRR